jgi:hypothetical protein
MGEIFSGAHKKCLAWAGSRGPYHKFSYSGERQENMSSNPAG